MTCKKCGFDAARERKETLSEIRKLWEESANKAKQTMLAYGEDAANAELIDRFERKLSELEGVSK